MSKNSEIPGEHLTPLAEGQTVDLTPILKETAGTDLAALDDFDKIAEKNLRQREGIDNDPAVA
jgi:hypothetical protein